MRGHFKFLNSRDVQYLTEGSLLFSSLAYFRHLELRTGDDWIGDSTEGYTSYTGTIVATKENPQAERMRLFGIDAPNGTISVTNMTMFYPHCLVMCFSTGEYSQLRSAMCTSPAPHLRYDAAVRIINARRLLSRIFHTGVISHTGVPVADVFRPPLMEVVTYENRHTDIAGSEILPVSPFYKQPKYVHQSEVRIVLQPHDRNFQDSVKIQISRPESVFAVVETDMDVGAEPRNSNDIYGGADLPSALENLAIRIEAWWIQNRVPDVPRHLYVIPITDEAQLAWSAHAEDTRVACEKCWQQFGREVASLYWDARLLNVNGLIYFRGLDRGPGLYDGTPRQLRDLAAEVRKKQPERLRICSRWSRKKC